MEEERAYVEWLRGQEETKDTKPAIQLVSQKHLAVYIIPHCDHAFFCGEEAGVGSETLLTKNRLEDRLGAGDDRCTYMYAVFSTVLFLPFLHFTPKKCEITIMA